MRTIDADALKKAIIEHRNDYVDDNFFWTKLFDIIDNAPTVDISGNERPHWIKIFENPYTNGYVCSVCGHKIQVTEQFLPKVTECEACGADMRKEGAE